MKKKLYFLKNVIFLVVFLLVFNSFEGYANTSNSIDSNESESLKYEIINETHIEPNTNLFNETVLKIDTPDVSLDGELDYETPKRNSSLWSENFLNLATFLTSIVSLFTLNEMRNQRHLTNTPKLHIISPKNVILVKTKKINNIEAELPTEWESEYLKKCDDEFLHTYSIPLKVINTGSSPALNIKITWNYDYEAIKYTVKKFNELDLGVKCEISKLFSLDLLEFSLKNIKRSYNMLLRPINIDYILPFSKNTEIEIFIPEIFTIFITLSISILDLSENKLDLSCHVLNAEIEYYDNINILHKEKYTIEFKINQLHWETTIDDIDKKPGKFKEGMLSVEAYKVNEVNLAQRVAVIAKKQLLFEKLFKLTTRS